MCTEVWGSRCSLPLLRPDPGASGVGGTPFYIWPSVWLAVSPTVLLDVQSPPLDRAWGSCWGKEMGVCWS